MGNSFALLSDVGVYVEFRVFVLAMPSPWDLGPLGAYFTLHFDVQKVRHFSPWKLCPSPSFCQKERNVVLCLGVGSVVFPLSRVWRHVRCWCG